MVPLSNILSLTDFRHNVKKYVDQLLATRSPLVLTINDKAVIVVKDVETFETEQRRLRELEEENRTLRLAMFKEAVAVGAEQAEQGRFSKRSFDDIIAAAHAAVTGRNSE